MPTNRPSHPAKNAESETRTFTRSDFFRLVQRAATTPVAKTSPKATGKSDSRKPGDCTGKRTR